MTPTASTKNFLLLLNNINKIMKSERRNNKKKKFLKSFSFINCPAPLRPAEEEVKDAEKRDGENKRVG